VLLIAAGGSLQRSMLGDLLAQNAVANGWAGVVIDGALRDSAVIGTLDLGVKALGTCPRKTDKRDQGLRDVAVEIAVVLVHPGEWLYADGDGVVVSAAALTA
jgi:regulator of ribonuclease activity A